MAAGGEFFGGLNRDLLAAMADYSDDELAVVRRFLEQVTDVVAEHARTGDERRAPARPAQR